MNQMIDNLTKLSNSIEFRPQLLQAILNKKFKLYKLPVGTRLYHERDSFFPSGLDRPSFEYAWFDFKGGFWSGIHMKPGQKYEIVANQKNDDIPKYSEASSNASLSNYPNNFVQYVYETTEEIELVSNYDGSSVFHDIDPSYTFDESNDYNQAAFAIQILGYNGILETIYGSDILDNCFVVLSKTVFSKFKLVRIEKIGSPSVHPGYENLSPSGVGAGSREDDGEKCLYSENEILEIRNRIGKKFLNESLDNLKILLGYP